jgi:hypothetical protein
MHEFEGRTYYDDRLFILDLCPATKGDQDVWAVITRRNCEGLPPRRADDFPTEAEAMAFIERIEPTTPRISLGGRSPNPTPSYQVHCERLKRERVPCAIEFRELSRNRQRQLTIEEAAPNEWHP